MYNYMIFNVSEKKMFNDFMSYYKRNTEDDFYFVSIDQPQMIQYLEEFLDRRIN